MPTHPLGQGNKGKLLDTDGIFTCQSKKTKKKSTVTVLPESIWIKMARTNVLGLAVVNINIVFRKHIL
jgi:hypothetical protein